MQDDISRIRRNWAMAVGAKDIVGKIFYEHLFAIAPDTRPLFPETLDGQGRKLVQTLSWIVDHLGDPTSLIPEAEALALRHLNYGVTAAQYDSVGRALIATLETGLGDAFTQEDAEAWRRVYTDLSKAMISAAYPEKG